MSTNIKRKSELAEIVKAKRMILLNDAKTEINCNYHLLAASESLEKDGTIKRKKVKVRYPNGALRGSWLLYHPDVEKNELLKFQRELKNRPYESHLKKYHEKKHSSKSEEVSQADVQQTDNSCADNVVVMSDYVKISNKEIKIKEYKGNRIVTAYDIAEIHNKEVYHVNEIFKQNQDKFILNEDYFIITREESKNVLNDLGILFTSNNQTEAYIFTEFGYLLLTKPFTDDNSWTVQRDLIKAYFKVKELKNDTSLQHIEKVSSIEYVDLLEMMVKQNNRITTLEEKLLKMASAFS